MIFRITSGDSLLRGGGTNNPRFRGTAARKEYGILRGTGPRDVPVENTGGPGTADGHWRDSVFVTELMTGFVSAPGTKNPLSRVTAASLQDLGYKVDMAAADPYALPDLVALAESGMRALQSPHLHTLPIFNPKILPDSAMVP